MYQETVIDRRQLASATKVLASEGMVLLTMVATDERHRGRGFVVRYVFADGTSGGRGMTTIRVRVRDTKTSLLSVTPSIPAANWYEREAHDMFGLNFEGHPDPRPLVYHGAWPHGAYPLRKDFDGAPECGCAHDSGYAFVKDDSPGVMEVPVGPIHAGIIEPGHFRFSAVGEEVRRLEARLFFTHRGVEKAVEGKDVDTGLVHAERICGACSFSHALSYSQAAEEALELRVPRRARQLRTLVMELERLYNHIGDVGNACAGVGYAFGISQLGILRERLMELNEELCGNRFLRGVCAVGGLRRDISRAFLELLRAALHDIVAEFRTVTEVMADSDSFQDRAMRTGVLTKAQALELAVVGPAARASGVDIDARRDFPHAAYDEVHFTVPTEVTGDVSARIAIRIREVEESIGIIDQILDGLAEGPVMTGDVRAPAGSVRMALGMSESARGCNVHWLMLDEAGRVERLRVRSASFCNWPAVPLTVPGNIVPDFPLINKSFELCYSCLDR